MPETLELYEGRTETVGTQDPRAQIPYMLTGVADEDEARDQADATIPVYKTFGENRLRLRDYELEMIVEGYSWRAVASYEKSDYTDEGEDPARQFTTMGGTEHITQSISTRGRYGDYAADQKGTIGFDGEDVKGLDIIVNTFEFQETQFKTDEEMTPSYIGTLYRLSPGVNDEDVLSPIGNFNEGELLYLGVSAQRRPDGIWELTFKFIGNPNRNDFDIGDINVDEKRGHDYMWMQFGKTTVGTDGGKTVQIKQPIAVYVEQVYQDIDFDDLQLDGWD